MSKYIHIYNEIAKKTRLVELIYLGHFYKDYFSQMYSRKHCWESLSYEKIKWMIGPLIHSNFLTCMEFKKKRKEMPRNMRKMLYHDECQFESYEFISDLAEINKFPDYYKFLMDKSGDCYTTVVGFNLLNYYHFSLTPIPTFYYFPPSNYAQEERMKYMIFDEDHARYLQKNTIVVDDPNMSKIVLLFTIKKKYNLPRFIFYKIIIELCKVHIENSAKYICKKCNDVLSSTFSSSFSSFSRSGKESEKNGEKNGEKKRLCPNCDYCHLCKKINDDILNCSDCGQPVCHDHSKIISYNVYCEYCYENSIF